MSPTSASIRAAFGTHMRVMAKQYPSLVLMPAEEDMGGSSSRWVAEAAGMATTGKMVVIAAGRRDMTGRFWDDIVHVASPSHQNITLVSLPPKSKAATTVDDLAMFRRVKSIEVYAPADPEEMRQVLSYCVARHTLCYVRCPGTEGQEVSALFGSDHRFRAGVWPRLRDGEDVTLISCGSLTVESLRAAQILASQGVQATVSHAGSINPFDREAVIQTLRRTRQIIVCEDHAGSGGLAGIVSELLAETGLAARLICVGAADGPVDAILRAAKAFFKTGTIMPKRRA